jgi:hypothetical protein
MMYHQPTNEDRRDEAPEVPESERCQACFAYPCECADEVDYDDETDKELL